MTRSQQPLTRFTRSLYNTIPIVLAGSMAMSLNLTGPVSAAEAEPRRAKDKPSSSELGRSIREALAAAHAASTAEALSVPETVVAATAPSRYTVVAGDTVSAVAARFGLATASVLALNGLSWKSVIFPGQSLTLTSSTAAPIASTPVASASASRYTIVAGDTVGRIAAKFGVSSRSILSANGLSASSIIYAGSSLAIPAAQSAASAAPVAIVPAVQISPAPTVGATSHVIKPGETIASIAASYGQSIQAVLAANGLGWSSIIYSGRALVIPSVVIAAPTAAGVTPLTQEMAQNATTIISVGRSLGVGDYGLVIALATAMQESSLRNLDYGDRDSLGLFQQRPSQGWGTPAQVRDPAHSARLFFGGPSGPNRGVTAGLLDISGWQSKTVTQAAQAVQLSAYPDAYAQWETSARAWLAQLG
ncbi:MAG: hypothetical protein RI885_118 [Actinomycetota bacterium]|jgi:LysM repeat protein